MPIRVLTICLAGIIVAGCASLPTPRSEAIHHALTEDATLRELAEQCAKLSPELRSTAVKAQRDWWRRNGNMVAAADYGLLELNWEDARQPLEEQRAYLSMQILEMVREDAGERVTEWVDDKKAERNCREELANFRDGDRDLSQDKKYYETLVALQNDKKIGMQDVEQARLINSRHRKYGRSLFVVEQKLQSNGCNKPQISLLRNEGPIEVYDAVCSDESYLLVRCEWGRCDIPR